VRGEAPDPNPAPRKKQHSGLPAFSSHITSVAHVLDLSLLEGNKTDLLQAYDRARSSQQAG
jgi:hypothetical protein